MRKNKLAVFIFLFIYIFNISFVNALDLQKKEKEKIKNAILWKNKIEKQEKIFKLSFTDIYNDFYIVSNINSSDVNSNIIQSNAKVTNIPRWLPSWIWDIQKSPSEIIKEVEVLEDIDFKIEKIDEPELEKWVEILFQEWKKWQILRIYKVKYTSSWDEISRELISENKKEPINEIIKVWTWTFEKWDSEKEDEKPEFNLKQKPNFTFKDLGKNKENKTLKLSFDFSDEEETLKSAKIKISNKNWIFKELSLTKEDLLKWEISLDWFDYDENYNLTLDLVYDLWIWENTENVLDENFIFDLELKEKPNLEIINFKKNDWDKSVEIIYDLTDKEDAYIEAIWKIYDWEKLLKTEKFSLKKWVNEKIVLENFDYNILYRLETEFSYDIWEWKKSETIESKKEFKFEIKSIEFRNVSKNILYKVSSNWNLTEITWFSSIPNDLENYIVKISRDSKKDVFLGVSEILEENWNLKVILKYPKLTNYKSEDLGFEDDYFFYMEKLASWDNIYTNFSDLINAINSKPNWTFILWANLIATWTSNSAYILKDFSWTLKSIDWKNYSILNLEKPLFNKISWGTVSNITLKNAKIDIAATGNQKIWILAWEWVNSKIDKVFIENWNINILSNVNTYHLGWLIWWDNGSTIKNVSLDVNINANFGSYHVVWGIVWNWTYTSISKSYVSWKLNIWWNWPTSGWIIWGLMMWELNNLVSAVGVNNWNKILWRDMWSSNSNIFTVENVATWNNYATAQTRDISKTEADNYRQNWELIIDNWSSIESSQNTDFSYSSVKNYSQSRQIAYENIEKLLPFYDRLTIVEYWNLVDTSSKLYSTKIKSIVPMSNNDFIVNLYKDYSKINNILVYFEDWKIEKYPVSFVWEFENSKVMEYSLNSNLLYTPEAFILENNSLISSISSELKNVDLYSDSMIKLLWVDLLEENFTKISKQRQIEKLKSLYIDDSFEEILNNIENHIYSIISWKWVFDISKTANINYLKKDFSENRDALVFGLAYLNKIYWVQFGDVNIKDLVLHKLDFYNPSVKNKDIIEKIASEKYEKIVFFENHNLFEKVIAPMINFSNLFDFLEKNRELFVPNLSNNEWFKASTKAFIYETSSKVDNIETRIYEKMKENPRFNSFILMMLNLKNDDIFAITNSYMITFGSFLRYSDIDKAEVQKNISKYANKWQDYLDFYYTSANDDVKKILSEQILEVLDWFYVKESGKKRWISEYETNYSFLNDFFGPLWRYYPESPWISWYTNQKTFIKFAWRDMLSDAWVITMWHELVHAYDCFVFLWNENCWESKNWLERNYRRWQWQESYAKWLLESASSPNVYYYWFNFMNDWTSENKSSVNKSPSRFKNLWDLQSYMKWVLDVIYSMDAIESEIILWLGKDAQKYFYDKMEFISENPVSENWVTYIDVDDKKREITDSEWNNLNLRTISDLIDNNIVMKSNYLPYIPWEKYQIYVRNNRDNYYFIPMFQPNFSWLENPNWTIWGLMFRKVIFDLIAEKWWEEWVIPYATNKYKSEAEKSWQALSDTYIFKKIFAWKYNSYSEFLKSMYNERISKREKLHPITITWDNKNVTIENSQKMIELFKDAVNKDLALLKANRASFHRENLKSEILKAYINLTNSFETSIFSE